jgi:elongation factor P
MDQESYEQLSVPRDLVGEPADFLTDNMKVSIDFIEGNPVAVHLPQTTVGMIVEADAVVKGQTASSSYKPAILSNGVRTNVPPHVGTGTRIVVMTEDGSYVERAKD